MPDKQPTGLSREDATSGAAKKQIFKEEVDPATGKMRKYQLYHGIWQEILQGKDLSDDEARTTLQGADVRKKIQELQRKINDLSRKIENAQKKNQQGKIEELQTLRMNTQDELTRLMG